jgi:glycosyltransferase involved in cell wall biosynthesis
VLRADTVRLAVVIQRFAKDVTGGAEYHARRVAEHLARAGHSVTVLTSTAKSTRGAWDDHYPAGVSRDGELTVIRFRTRRRARRNLERVRESLRRILRRSPVSLRQIWTMWANPYVPELVQHLRAEGHRYDAVLFFTYFHYPSLVGALATKTVRIGIPLAHDDDEIGTDAVRRLLRSFDAIIANTEEERDLVARVLGDEQRPITVAGCGIDEPPSPIPERPLAAPYALYLGRAKDGTEILPACIAEFHRRYGDETFEAQDGTTFRGRELVLVTVGDLRQDAPGIRSVSHVDFAARWAWAAGTEVLVNPSLFESLSLTLLEAWWVERPVLARAQCEVMAKQIGRAGGGATFEDAATFADALATLLRSRARRAEMGARGRAYATSRYTWATVMEHYARVLDAHVKR